MSQFLETIKVCEGKLQNMDYHNQRCNNTRKQFFGESEMLDLSQTISIPNLNYSSIYKCRIIYSKTIEKIEFEEYIPRLIKSFQIVVCNDIDYSFKYLDRTKLLDLKYKAPLADEIIIIKNGCITDCSYANLIFFDGNQWITPNTPLLKGTMRSYCLDNGLIFESKITVSSLSNFKKFRILNAMNNWNDSPEFDLSIIHY